MSVTGIVDAFTKPTSGVNDYGSWTMQRVYIRDQQNPKTRIKVKLFDHPPLGQDSRGKQVWFTATNSAKDNKLIGLLMEDDKRNGQPTGELALKVAMQAEISYADGPAPAEQAQPPQQRPAAQQPNRQAQQKPPAQQQSPPPPPPAPPPAPAPAPAPAPEPPQKTAAEITKQREEGYIKAVTHARQEAGKLVNAYKIALRAGGNLFDWYQNEFGEAMTAEQHQAAVSSIFIALDQRERRYLTDALPHGDLTKYIPHPAKPATPPPAADNTTQKQSA